jgi:hypothetical protein
MLDRDWAIRELRDGGVEDCVDEFTGSKATVGNLPVIVMHKIPREDGYKIVFVSEPDYWSIVPAVVIDFD